MVTSNRIVCFLFHAFALTYTGKHFSIVAISEGAMSVETAQRRDSAEAALEKARQDQAAAKERGDKAALKKAKAAKKKARTELEAIDAHVSTSTQSLTHQLEELTKLESRVTILGHVQRGGTPSPMDRLLATRLGSAAARLICEGVHGVLVANRGNEAVPIPFEEIVNERNQVPLDHPWVHTARSVGTSLGD